MVPKIKYTTCFVAAYLQQHAFRSLGKRGYMRKLFELLAVSFFVAALSFGQTTSITGTVLDPSGAVIPGATVTITNNATGTERTTVSDAQGGYTIPQVTPGTYKVSAKAGGFTEKVINNVQLLVNQPATITITFEKVGSTATTVEVEANAVAVNTTDASLGNAIDNSTIVQLPSFARNVTTLLANQPGVTLFGSAGGNLDYRSGSVNGGKSDQSNITLDGADVGDQNSRAAYTSVLRVTLDSVEEFRTTTTNFDAASGRGSGADIALVTKSGTNNFHGSLYEYRRGTETSANSFFNNRAGVPRAPLLINIFGGSAGGAIKKNRLFYFINYEGRRDASAVSVSRTVPSDTMRQGIVQYHNSGGQLVQLTPSQIQQIDPAGLGVNQAALAQMNKYPVGNNPLGGDRLNTTGYIFNAPGYNVQNTYIAKFDYKIDNDGKHSIFWRGNLQNDWADNNSVNAPQFPGLPPNSVSLGNGKGFATGYTAILKPNLVSNLRYGFTRAGAETTGVLASNYEWFRGLDTPYGTSTGIARIVPVHTINEDMSWIHGSHDIRFGAVVRMVSNSSVSYAHSYSSASSNPSWLKGSGTDLTPASLGIASSDRTSAQYAMGALLGIEAQGNANYNYMVNGTLLPVGAPVSRDFVNHEGEMYLQDTWKVNRKFTVTAGVRFSLEPTVYEANGQEASTNVPLANWLGQRALLADEGKSQAGAGLISFVPLDQGRPMYPYHKNWSPRLGMAYSPSGDSGLSHFLFGGAGKTSIRAGAGMYYDLIGQPLAQTFNSTAFGLSSSLTSPPNVLNTAQSPRFTNFFTVPSAIVPPPGKGGLPATYPTSGAGSFAITNSIDDQLKAPYTINLDFSIQRELPHGLFVQASYVGRLSRHSLVNRDLAMPTNLRDPASGQTYFQAMTQLMYLVDVAHTPISQMPKIPFFENMWKGAAGGGLTATQVWANDYINNSNPGDFTNTLNDADNGANCSTSGTTFNSRGVVDTMGCGVQGPFMIFNPQFSALSAYSSIGIGDYHSMQWSIQKRFSSGLQMTVNYTLSKSIDLGSTPEGQGSFSGFIQNTWNPNEMRAVSTYDTLHQINVFGVYQIPVGRGQHFGTNMNRVLDAFIGGWQVSGVYRQTSGLPTTISNGQRWPTNWEVDAFATPNGSAMPAVTSTSNAQIKGGGPNLWANPAAAFAAFMETPPGQVGLRNNFRGQGFFNIDSGVYKNFRIREGMGLQVRWESFNLTNSVRFDPNSVTGSTLSISNFGVLTSTLTAPRQMQFAARLTW